MCKVLDRNNFQLEKLHTQLIQRLQKARSDWANTHFHRDSVPKPDFGKVALLIIDIQNDFLPPGGSLAVLDGHKTIPVINVLRRATDFDCIVLSQDFHPQNHVSFASNHPGTEPFQTIPVDVGVETGETKVEQVMWPNHCVQGTFGSEFSVDLIVEDTDIVVQKGTDPSIDSYSAFWDNGKQKKTDLDTILKHRGIATVFVCGLATDYCVSYTAMDAALEGYKTYFIEDASRGIASKDVEAAKAKMTSTEYGIEIVKARDVAHIVRLLRQLEYNHNAIDCSRCRLDPHHQQQRRQDYTKIKECCCFMYCPYAGVPSVDKLIALGRIGELDRVTAPPQFQPKICHICNRSCSGTFGGLFTRYEGPLDNLVPWSQLQFTEW